MKQNIVILGAGFGGLKCALRLDDLLRAHRLRPTFDIVLVDRNNFQTFVPMLYEVANTLKEEASAPTLKELITIPLEQVVTSSGIRFWQDEVSGIDLGARAIQFKGSEPLPFAYAVIALGSETHTFDIPGIGEHAYFLKTLPEAIRVRNRLEEEMRNDRTQTFSVLIGGGGLTGVELAGELGGALKKLKRKYPQYVRWVEIRLVEGGQEILPGFPQQIVDQARVRLARLGVKIETHRLISKFDGRIVTHRDGGNTEVDMLIWTGGVKACHALKDMGLPLGQRGDVEVEVTLEVRGEEKIFAIGDSACVINPATGKPLAWNIPIAEEQAIVVAQNILRSIKRLPLLSYHAPRRMPVVIPIGGKYAIADLGFLRFYGLLGWCIKHLVTLRYYLSILPWWRAIPKWLQAMRVFIAND